MSVSVTLESRTRINPLKAGWTLGTLLGLWHLTWSALVALGWAQALIDFVFWMHFIQPVYVVQVFNPAVAFVLVLVISAIGFVVGAIFGVLWNWIQDDRGAKHE